MSLHAVAVTTASTSATASLRVRRLTQLVLALLLIAFFADLSVLYTQYAHGGAYATKGFYESDWLMFYHAAERLRDGGNPYIIADEFRNPPPFLLLARVALVLPYLPSRVLWSFASACMLLGAYPIIASAIGWRPVRKTSLLLAVFILLYMPVVLLVPLAANTSAPLVLSYALALWFFTRDRDGWAGATLAVALLVKPQLAFLTLPLLIYKGRWRATVAYLGTLGVVLGLSLAVVGLRTFAEFYQMERATAGMANTLSLWIEDNPSIHAAFLQAWPQSVLAGPLAYVFGLALVAALAWYWRGPWQPRTRRFCAGWAMLPLVDLLIVPYAHSDDLVLLIVPAVVLYALHCRSDLGSSRVAPWILPTLIALYLGPVLVLFFRQHFMVPAMAAALWVLWRNAAA